MSSSKPTVPNEFQILQRFVPRQIVGERCDLCSAVIGNEHPHLLEIGARKIVCACPACSLLFGSHGSSRYKRIPVNARLLAGFELTDGEWDSLAIPIGLAFFFFDSRADKVVAFYPSPAGATESLLDLDAWKNLATVKTMLNNLEPDVEALLVNRIGGAREYYVAPIDTCYKLVGLIRTYWRGLSGGHEVWTRIAQFFGELGSKTVRY